MIEQLKLKNFKCFESLNLDLKKLNVLMGLNGMGKSSVLQSLLLLRQSYQENRLTGLKLNGRYVQLGNGSDILAERAEEEEIGISLEGPEAVRTLFSYRADSDLLDNQLPQTDAFADNVLFGERFAYLSAYRIEPKSLYRITDEKELGRRELGNSGEYSLQFLSQYGGREIENEQVLYSQSEEKSLAWNVSQWMSLIAPGILPQVSVNKGNRNAELKYQFIMGEERSNAYKSVNVGFGITYVLPVIIELLSARPGDLILLENPEAHIHPAGQRHLGELLTCAAAGGVQIIAETHSDHVLNGIRLAAKKRKADCEDICIFFFDKDEEDGYRHRAERLPMDQEGNIEIWPRGFLDEWDKALLELL